MKKIILISLFIPLLGKAQFKIVNTATINLLELRSDTWPINLQRVTKQSDTTYVVNFRTQEYPKDVIMKALVFPNLDQFKYFQKALSALKSGSTGDVAEFKNYTIKRVDIKREGVWYTLSYDGAVTNFQQTEADKMIATIGSL
ncbi:MAG TPA: hypothetical protein VHC50_11335 [Puia sp.]|jgi:hypothetical protein|nr:hypothetical protein [Puia sp.]